MWIKGWQFAVFRWIGITITVLASIGICLQAFFYWRYLASLGDTTELAAIAQNSAHKSFAMKIYPVFFVQGAAGLIVSFYLVEQKTLPWTFNLAVAFSILLGSLGSAHLLREWVILF